MRFKISTTDDGWPEFIHDMESGAAIIELSENHDWTWITEDLDPKWDDKRYSWAIANTIVEALNRANIPKPNIEVI